MMISSKLSLKRAANELQRLKTYVWFGRTLAFVLVCKELGKR